VTRRARHLVICAVTVAGAVCAVTGYLTGQLYERLTHGRLEPR